MRGECRREIEDLLGAENDAGRKIEPKGPRQCRRVHVEGREARFVCIEWGALSALAVTVEPRAVDHPQPVT